MAGINQSGIYSDKIIGDLRPKVMCFQLYPNIVSGPQSWTVVLPSGHSNVENIAGSCPSISILPSGFLNFGSGSNVLTEPRVSRTIPFIFITKYQDRNQVTDNVSIFNMKLWIDDDIAFSGLSNKPYIQMLPSGDWNRNFILESGAYGAYEVPRSLPSVPNIARIDGTPWMSGIGYERSQIIYSSIVLPSGEYATGRYGGLGGHFHWRFTYDWTSEYSHVHVGEGSGTHCDY